MLWTWTMVQLKLLYAEYFSTSIDLEMANWPSGSWNVQTLLQQCSMQMKKRILTKFWGNCAWEILCMIGVKDIWKLIFSLAAITSIFLIQHLVYSSKDLRYFWGSLNKLPELVYIFWVSSFFKGSRHKWTSGSFRQGHWWAASSSQSRRFRLFMFHKTNLYVLSYFKKLC